MTVGCSRCETPFDTVHSAAQHAWKSQDGDHEDLETLDEAIEEMVTDGKSPDEMDLPNGNDGGGSEPSPHGDASPSAEAVTDGGGLGLEGPPEVEADEGDLEEETDDDELTCPGCGEGLGVTDQELREHVDGDSAKLTCSCGSELGWSR